MPARETINAAEVKRVINRCLNEGSFTSAFIEFGTEMLIIRVMPGHRDDVPGRQYSIDVVSQGGNRITEKVTGYLAEIK